MEGCAGLGNARYPSEKMARIKYSLPKLRDGNKEEKMKTEEGFAMNKQVFFAKFAFKEE